MRKFLIVLSGFIAFCILLLWAMANSTSHKIPPETQLTFLMVSILALILFFVTIWFSNSKDNAIVKLENTNSWTQDEIKQFKTNLMHVISWTEELSKNFDYEKGFYGLVFRQTNPLINSSKLYSFEGDQPQWTIDDYSFENYTAALEQAIKARSTDKKVDLTRIEELGRVLCFQTCITTHDGTPIAESRNFMDQSDAPPIDTWFFLKRDYFHSDSKCDQSLFCWIPKEFEQIVQRAIDVEILDSYRWLDENDEYLYKQIINNILIK